MIVLCASCGNQGKERVLTLGFGRASTRYHFLCQPQPVQMGTHPRTAQTYSTFKPRPIVQPMCIIYNTHNIVVDNNYWAIQRTQRGENRRFFYPSSDSGSLGNLDMLYKIASLPLRGGGGAVSITRPSSSTTCPVDWRARPSKPWWVMLLFRLDHINYVLLANSTQKRRIFPSTILLILKRMRGFYDPNFTS